MSPKTAWTSELLTVEIFAKSFAVFRFYQLVTHYNTVKSEFTYKQMESGNATFMRILLRTICILIG